MFLYEFEHKCIQAILKLSEDTQELTQRLIKITHRFYEMPLLEQQLFNVLEYAVDVELNGDKSLYSGTLNVSGNVEQIQHLMHLHKNREYQETPILDSLSDLLKLIKDNYEGNESLALLSLFNVIFIEKENDRKPAQFYSCSYRDGVETLNFYFDVLNDYAGYTKLYYDELKETDQEWKNKLAAMRQDQDNPYLANDYPHLLFTIEKIDKLLKMNDLRAVNWLETLIIRVYNDTRYRRHFPVFLETSH